MTLGGTKPEYVVDIYSGNHPFYQGQKSFLILDEGQLNKFRKRFAGLDELSEVQGASNSK
jgi:large subunit ribosomal protein L31